MKISLILLPILAVAACSPAPPSRSTAAQQAACRSRADEMFLQQNRGAAYANDQYVSSTRDAPFGGNVPTNMTNSLSDRYSRQKMMDNCLNARGQNPGASGPAASNPAPTTP